MSDVPPDVLDAAKNLYREANNDLDLAVASLANDIQTHSEGPEMECMYFGNSLVLMHEHLQGQITHRLHATYMAALYRLAMEHIAHADIFRAGQIHGLQAAIKSCDDYIEQYGLTGESIAVMSIRNALNTAANFMDMES